MIVTAALALILATSAASASGLWTSMLLGQQLGESIGGFANHYAQYHATRGSWNARIHQLEGELARCGNCSERSKLEQELNYWRSIETTFVRFATAMIDWGGSMKVYGSDSAAWARSWKLILGLPLEKLPEQKIADYQKWLEQEKTKDNCIPIYLSAMRCELQVDIPGDPLRGTPCGMRKQTANACQIGKPEFLQASLSALDARRQGRIEPVIYRQGGYYKVYFGPVPDSFMPKLPSFEQTKIVHLDIEMEKSGPGTLQKMSFRNGPQGWEIWCDHSVHGRQPKWQAHTAGTMCAALYDPN